MINLKVSRRDLVKKSLKKIVGVHLENLIVMKNPKNHRQNQVWYVEIQYGHFKINSNKPLVIYNVYTTGDA